MTFEFLVSLGGKLLEGLRATILLLLICGTIGNLLAIPVALARVSSKRWLSYPAFTFILVMRGTPVLVQLYLVYYGLGEVFSQIPELRHSVLWPYLRDGFCYAALALSLNTAGYCGEILRGAIQSVPRGQAEAGQALGLPPRLITVLIVLPQAIRIALPALAGQTILLLKATALASTITIFELMSAANFVRSQSFRVYEPLFGAALVYIGLTYLLTLAFGLLERRLSRSLAR